MRLSLQMVRFGSTSPRPKRANLIENYVMTWRQFAFNYNKRLEKKDQLKHYTFQRETTVGPA